MTERKGAAALGDALKAMFRLLERRETPQSLRATVDQLEAADRAPCAEPPPNAEPPAAEAPELVKPSRRRP